MYPRSCRPIALLAGVLLAGSASALSLLGGDDQQDDLLAPEDAFRSSVVVDNGKIVVSQTIEPGYFTYKSKYKVLSDEAYIGSLLLPAGTVKQDEFFGEVETFREQVDFTADISSNSSATNASVTVVSQGCADIGVCYPPMSEKFIVEIPAGSEFNSELSSSLSPLPVPFSSSEPAAQSDPVLMDTFVGNSILSSTDSGNFSSPVTDSGSSNNTLFDSMRLTDDEEEVLHPDVAFTVFADQANADGLPVQWKIVDGYFLYDPKFSFEVLEPTGLTIVGAELSEGKIKDDEFFGEVEVHRQQVNAQLSFNNTSTVQNVKLKVGYQGCADAGICYPPQYKELTIKEIPAAAIAAVASANTGSASGGNLVTASQTISTVELPMAEQDRLAASLGSGKTFTTILTFFGLGLLLTFTPCVLPMVPILSSIIVGKGDKIGTGKAFSLSLVYVLAMALTYTIAGVIIGLTGENIQATLQHPYVLISFAALFVILSASMFGLYELQMPAFIQNRLMAASNNQKSGSYAGVASMGFLSALIVGPCVTAPLVGALIYIGQTGDAVLGGAALFALSMGMGLPLLIIGTSFGKYLPTAGPWMDKIKAAFGFMMLGLAIWMLDRILPTAVIMLLASLLLIMIGMFLGVFDGKPSGSLDKIGRGVGYASVVYGTLLLIGVGTGSGTLLKPLQGLTNMGGVTGEVSAGHVTFERVKSIPDLEAALDSARTQNKPVIFDFYADWCVSCKEMEAFTFTNPQVAERMNRAMLLQADVTANDKLDKELLRHYGIFGPPAIIFYDNEGVEVQGARVVGFMAADKFRSHLDRVL